MITLPLAADPDTMIRLMTGQSVYTLDSSGKMPNFSGECNARVTLGLLISGQIDAKSSRINVI